MSSRAGTQLLGELCVLTALLIPVPGEVFVCGVTQGREKGEKVLLTRWMLQKKRYMASVAVTSFFPYIL